MLIEALMPYRPAVGCLVGVGCLHMIQFVVADVAAIRRRHPPGKPIETGPEDFLFRAVRAHANTNEGLAAFALLVAAAIALAGRAQWVNLGVATFLCGRLAHMVFYYADLRIARSVAFAVGLLGQTAVLLAALLSLV